MILQVGKAERVHFIRGIKKTNIFECGDNGMVVERENNIITLYVTNSRCSEIYCEVTLGHNRDLKKHKFLGVAFSQEIMLLDGGDILVVVDYAQKKVAVNRPELPVLGKGDWGEDPRMDWTKEFDVMFGLLPSSALPGEAADTQPQPEPVDKKPEDYPVPDEKTTEYFWNWFSSHEQEIVEKTEQGGDIADMLNARLRIQLSVVFPYEKPDRVEFHVGLGEERNELAVYHFNNPRMERDARVLGERMPEELKARWNYYIEA